MGATGKGQTRKNLLLPQQVGERLEEETCGGDAVAVASIPIPAVLPRGLHRRLHWHPGIPRERVAVAVATAVIAASLPLQAPCSPALLTEANWGCKQQKKAQFGISGGTRKQHSSAV